MTIGELLTVTVASHIYVITGSEDKYFSTDNGLTFKRSLFNTDNDLTDYVLNRTVKYFKPVSDYAIYIYI